jgi:hypothetical protein
MVILNFWDHNNILYIVMKFCVETSLENMLISMGGHLPHINSSSLVDLHWPRCPGIPHWTQRRPHALHAARVVADAWIAQSCDELELLLGVVAIVRLVLTSAGFPWQWKSPAVGWSRPVAPLTAASNILPEHKAWALGEKPLCGRSPQHHAIYTRHKVTHKTLAPQEEGSTWKHNKQCSRTNVILMSEWWGWINWNV